MIDGIGHAATTSSDERASNGLGLVAEDSGDGYVDRDRPTVCRARCLVRCLFRVSGFR